MVKYDELHEGAVVRALDGYPSPEGSMHTVHWDSYRGNWVIRLGYRGHWFLFQGELHHFELVAEGPW